MVQKHIHGNPVTPAEFKDAVVGAVADRVKADAAQVAGDLGITDPADIQRLRVFMGNLAGRGWLAKVRPGVYEVDPSFQKRQDRSLEAELIRTIQAHGGFATWSAILSDFDALPSESLGGFGGRSGGGRGSIEPTLKASPAIQHYVISDKEKYWGLRRKELMHSALDGKGAEFLLKYQRLMAVEVSGLGGIDMSELREDIEVHFEHVGLALTRLREQFGQTTGDMAASPGVGEAIGWAKDRSHPFNNAVREEMKRSARWAAQEQGHDIGSTAHEYLLDEEEPMFNVHAVRLLEHGAEAAHRAVPAAFYYSVGKNYKVCPASLSRGMLVYDGSGELHDRLASMGGMLP